MALLEDCLALEAKGQRNKAVRKLTHWIESKDKKKPKDQRLAWYHLARMVLQLERPADAASYLTKARSFLKKMQSFSIYQGSRQSARGILMKRLAFLMRLLKRIK